MVEVRFSVIGHGNIGSRHVRYLKEMDGAVVHSVCDIDEERAREGADEAGTGYHTSFGEVLRDPEVDVVDICTPSGLHADMSIRALEAGKNVLSEKPMALTLDEADRIIEAEKRSGKRYFLVKQNRYNPPVAILKELVERGALGEIFMISSNVFWNRRKSYFTDEPWRGTLDLDGGALFTQCSHFVDLILWIGGIPKRVSAQMANVDHPYIDVEDLGCVRMDFARGCIGVLNYTTAIFDRNMEGSISVLGTKGSVRIGGKYLNEVTEWNVEKVDMPEIPPGGPPNMYKGGYQGSMSSHDKVLKNVLGVLSKGETIAVTAGQGRLTVEVMQAAHMSTLYNRSVNLPLRGKEASFDMRKTPPFPKRNL